MHDVRQIMRELVEKAKLLHLKERTINLESVLLVGELDRLNSAVNLGMSSEALSKAIALSPNQLWKRAQAARVMRHFPEALAMVKAGETEVSHLALLAPRITEANADLLLRIIKNKSKRDVEGLLSRVTAEGRLIDKEEEFEVRLKLTKTEMALLDRAREVLASRGQVPSTAVVFAKALADLLWRRDPQQKAERTAKHPAAPSPGKKGKAKASAASEEGCAAATQPKRLIEDPKTIPGDKSGNGPSPGKRPRRPAIPAAVRHAVNLRDGCQCTEILEDGSRCPERMMIELDHVTPWCQGGHHTVEGLQSRCRRHNQAKAERELGPKYMVSWIQSRGRVEQVSACL